MKRVKYILLVLSVLSGPVFGAGTVGEGRLFLRFTNTRPDEARVQIRVVLIYNDNEPLKVGWHSPDYRVGRDGLEAAKIPIERWLEPGQSSPWVDIGQYMILRGLRSPDSYLAPVLCSVMTEGEADGLHLLTEVAQGRGQGVMRRINTNRPGIKARDARKRHEYPWRLGWGIWQSRGPYLPTVGLLIPTRPEHGTRIYTLAEALDWQLDFIEDFPGFGRKPAKLIFTTRGRREIKDALGYNGWPEGTVQGNLGDEIFIVHHALPAEEQEKRFREHLKARGVDPLDYIKEEDEEKARALSKREQWQFVHIKPGIPRKPRHYYESANFRYHLWYEQLRAKRLEIEAAHPTQRVLTGSNFSPHLNVWPDVRQWIGPFKSGAMTMSWSEDWWWQIAEPTPQTHAFLLDALRLAHSYHGAPIQYYIMPLRGQSPDNFRRMNVLALAHGAKILNHFHTQSQVMTTGDYVDFMESPPMYQAMHDVISQAGAVESRLYPAMPQKAAVAVMLSRASDTWDTEDLGGAGHLVKAKYNVNNDERKSLYLALRHAQVPVDLITDEDIAEGKLAPYRVLYLVGSEMLAQAAEPLKQWVGGGGILYATAGGGLLDEYRQPLETLYEMYGIRSHQLARRQRHIRKYPKPRAWDSLAKTDPLDTLAIGHNDQGVEELRIGAWFYRETFEPTGTAGSIGVYEDEHAVGGVVNHYGQGRTIYVGALAGLAYMRPAMIATARVLPTKFSAKLRDFITTPVRWARLSPPVAASDPLVETQFMTGAGGTIVVLINWRDEPVEDLVLRFPGHKTVTSVRSLSQAGVFKGSLETQERGTLEITTEDGVPRVRLRLEVTDYLLVN